MKNLITILLAIFAAAVSGGTSMLPETVKQQFGWWQLAYVIAALALLVILFIVIPIKIWKSILNFFPIRILRILCTQHSNPSQFLYVQKSKFVFIPMSGGINRRTWSCEFNILSCMFSDLNIDQVKVHVTYPIDETATISKELSLLHMNITPICVTEANMSDTSFHDLSESAKQKINTLDIRIELTGFKNGKRKFLIKEDVKNGQLTDWGKQNDQS